MEDYTSNSKKDKKEDLDKPEKEIKKVTKGEVLLQKKGLGQKFKDVFIAVDLKSVTHYVIYDICIPAFQNMLVDGVSKGIERMTFGERSRRPGAYGGIGPRVTYNSPVRRGYGGVDNLDRTGLPPRRSLTPSSARGQVNTDIILASREEALLVLESMTDILDKYDVVTVGDLNSLVGIAATHVDEKWGWGTLVDVQIRAIREGFLLDLPSPQPLQ